MAENAAHLSSAPQKNPSIFEVIAQESLMSSLEASTKVLFDIISNKDSKYEWLSKWHKEIYLCFNCFLQYHYLNRCGGSFSEAFYNLRRAPLTDPSKVSLSSKQNIKSLMILVFLPYAAEKIKLYIDRWQSTSQIPKTENQKFIENLIKYYRHFCMSYETVKFIQYIRYLMGSSTTHTPLLNLAGVQLVYQTDESKKYPDFSWKDVIMSPFRSSREPRPDLKSVAVKLICQGLELSAFFIQFLRWWNSEEMKNRLNNYPVPNAPHHMHTDHSLRFNGLCPICMRKRRVEVALQTSGYAFCYKCILEVVNKTGKCPVSGLPSSSKDLIRVYESVM